jgi:hypothetical protein
MRAASWPCVLAAVCASTVPACDGSDRVPMDAALAGTGGAGEAGAGGAGRGGGGGTGGSGASGAGGESGRGGLGGRGSLPAPNVDAILEAGCATSTMQSQLLPSNLLFVIDRSSSMVCNPPPITDSPACELDSVRADPEQPSKWEITRESLLEAIRALPSDTVVGLSYFSNDDACGVHSMPSVGLAPLDEPQRSAIRASLSNVEPAGSTPLVGAVLLAYRHLHESALAGTIRGNKFVVLITDGHQSEQCSDPERCDGAQACTELLVSEEVPRAAGTGVLIKTFVIGVPGSEPARVVLSQIAEAGRTPRPDCDAQAGNCHFDMTEQDDLGEALLSALSAVAVRAALSCELPMPRSDAVAVDFARVNVVYSPADGSPPRVVPMDGRKACDGGANGWQYADGETKIQLCGAACDTVRADRGARLDVVLGCPVRGPD